MFRRPVLENNLREVALSILCTETQLQRHLQSYVLQGPDCECIGAKPKTSLVSKKGPDCECIGKTQVTLSFIKVPNELKMQNLSLILSSHRLQKWYDITNIWKFRLYIGFKCNGVTPCIYFLSVLGCIHASDNENLPIVQHVSDIYKIYTPSHLSNFVRILLEVGKYFTAGDRNKIKIKID